MKALAALFAMSTLVLGAIVVWREPLPAEVKRVVVREARPELPRAVVETMGEDEILDQLRRGGSIAQLRRWMERLESEAAVPLLAELVDDPRWGVAEAAMETLGRIGGDDATELLGTIATTGTSRMRGGAIKGLARVRTERSTALLVGLVDDGDDPVAREAIAALGASGMPSDVAALARLVRGRFREAVMNALGAAGSREAEALLAELATDADLAVRVEAISAMVDIGDPQTIALLLAMLQSGSEAEKIAAAGALASIGAVEAVPALITASRLPSRPVQVAAIDALGRLGGPEANAVLLAVLRASNRQLASLAAQALVTKDRADGARLLLVELRAGGLDPRVRADVLFYLVHGGGPGVDDFMLELVQRDNKEDVALAAQYLTGVKHPQLETLARRWLAKGTREEQSSALSALVALGTPASRQLVLDTAAQARGPLRRVAIGALAELKGDPAATAALREMIAAGGDYASEAVIALTLHGGERLVADLVSIAASEDGLASSAAFDALAEAGTPQAIAALVEHARKEGGPALWALVETGAPETLAVVRDGIAAEDDDQAKQAVEALARLGTPESHALLDESLRSPRLAVRTAAAESLAGRAEASDVPRLVALAGDKDPDVRRWALQGLANVGTPETDRALLAALDSPDPQTARAAADILRREGLGTPETEARIEALVGAHQTRRIVITH